MSQTSVSINQDVARAGLLYDTHSAKTVESKLAEGTGLFFGRGCVLGTDKERQVKASTSDADVFAGIMVHDHARESQTDGLDAGLADKATAAALTVGPIWVEVAEAVDPGDPVAMVMSAGADNMKFGKTTGATFITVAGAKWLTSASGAGLAALSL